MNTELYTPGYTENASDFMALRSVETHAQFFAPYLQPGMDLLDCGCGPGTITLGLAQRVAPGRVTGIDSGDSQIERARQNAAAHGVTNVEFRTASVYELPFADNTFDAVFSHALLEHLAEPVAALRELRRVLRPGGVAGVCSPDWSGFIIAPMSPELRAAIEFYKRIQTDNGGDVDAGGKLGSAMLDAGFTSVQMDARYECYRDRTHIGEYLAQRIEGEDGQDYAHGRGWRDRAGLARMAATLRNWQQKPDGLFAQAWVSAVGRVK